MRVCGRPRASGGLSDPTGNNGAALLSTTSSEFSDWSLQVCAPTLLAAPCPGAAFGAPSDAVLRAGSCAWQ
jgi:hypothetical protein